MTSISESLWCFIAGGWFTSNDIANDKNITNTTSGIESWEVV